MKTKPSEFESFIKKVIVKAGKATLKHFGRSRIQYSKKHADDIVTQADLESHDIITSAIKKNYPTHGILSEEDKGYNVDAEYVWIIDPLDGTTNFHKGIPIYGVLIALAKNNTVIAGGAYFPYFKDFYYGELGKGVYKNGTPVRCSGKTDFSRTRGGGYIQIEGKHTNQIRKMAESSEKFRYWITEYGSGAYDMVLTVEGKNDWYFSPPLGGDVWDTAAISIMLEEAGCIVTNLEGKTWKLSDKTEMIAANPSLHYHIMKIIR
jgi:myo-inositol-1(or 4)-monophosphatase